MLPHLNYELPTCCHGTSKDAKALLEALLWARDWATERRCTARGPRVTSSCSGYQQLSATSCDHHKKSKLQYIWSNYSDLTRPHPKWWFSKGILLISGKSRLVKYYNLARYMESPVITEAPAQRRMQLLQQLLTLISCCCVKLRIDSCTG